MNCDRTFDVLTRGPFPSGNNGVDTAVECHLSACHDCRQLAEALRPAVGLFHESLADTDSLSLPGYRGELHPVTEGLVQTVAAPANETWRMTRGREQRRSRKTAALIWPIAAAGLIGLVVGMFGEDIRNRAAGEVAATLDAAGLHSTEVGDANREGRQLLSLLNLPAACRDTKPAANGWIRCCTRCHAAAESATAPAVPLTTLTSSCLACHSSAHRADVSWTFPPLRWDEERMSERLTT